MIPNQINYDAVRTLGTLCNRRGAELDIAAQYDAHFDGGEWSSALHDEIFLNEMRRLLLLVSARYGLTPEALDNMVYAADHHNLEMFYRHLATKENRYGQ